MMHVDPAVLLRSIDVLAESHRAALAAIEVLRSIVAGSIERHESIDATVQACAPAVALVAPASATPRTKPMSSTERSQKRRAALSERGYGPHEPGRIEDLDKVQRRCNGDSVAPVAPSVAPGVSSDSSFLIRNQNDDDVGEDARARRCNEKCNESYQRSVAPDDSVAPHDNVVNFRVTADQADNLTPDVHRIVQQRARFPHQMLPSTTAGHIHGLLKQGVSPHTIRDAVHAAAPKAQAPIKTFWYFAKPAGAILRAHADAMRALSIQVVQPELPLDLTAQPGGRDRKARIDPQTAAADPFQAAADDLMELVERAIDAGSAPPVSLAAAKGAQQLFRLCRKRKDIASPREFVFAVAYVLNGYSDDVIRRVTDPASGLPGTLKFPLEIADVKRACEMQELCEKATADDIRRFQFEMSRREEVRQEEDEQRARDEERRRTGPPWSAVMAIIKQKTLGRLHNNAEKEFRPGSFCDGTLTIFASKEACDRAVSLRYFLKKTFPEVVDVRFVEQGDRPGHPEQAA